MLDRMCKGTTLQQGETAVSAAKVAGIQTLGQFILGVPGETLESIKRTVSYAKKLDPDYVQFYCAIPSPGTALWQEAQTGGFLSTSDWSRFELNQAIISTSCLSPEALRRARIRAYIDFYMRVPVAVRTLRRLSLDGIAASAAEAGAFIKSWVLDG